LNVDDDQRVCTGFVCKVTECMWRVSFRLVHKAVVVVVLDKVATHHILTTKHTHIIG
jgi:hypothetical protein